MQNQPPLVFGEEATIQIVRHHCAPARLRSLVLGRSVMRILLGRPLWANWPQIWGG
jgi:hypothetical protein